GLIPAPDIPEKIANEIAGELPGLLARRVDAAVSWEVPVVVDPLTGSGREAPEILDVCRERMLREGWDLAVCLTDLPVYRGGRLVAADVSASRGVAGLSLPALGATRLRPRARDLTLRLAHELYVRTKEPGPDDSLGRGPHWAGTVGPFRRVDPPDEDMKATDVDVRFAAPGAPGHLRLWSGMVLANRPWKMLPAFKGAIAAAFATGAYALIIPSIWLLADSVGWARLVLLMVAAVVAMAAWIILAHHLWERPDDPDQRGWAALYNGVTVLTVTSAVLCAYAILFALIFLAAWVFVPGGYFRTTLKHPVGFGEYLTLAWLGTSLATVAGALGASLEDEETVREASYGYRQRRRHENDDDEK
ncbi:MAG TPA: hypothetical protein VKA73_03420, partial [Rubrobacter sp.]|nr:hypothetical protein [Rubrobacter sp.]